jgi:hypothetical protein
MLMRKQNFAMNVMSAIPIFGFTQQVQDYELEHNGMEQMVHSIIWNHPNVLAIKPTASTTTLGKYILLVDCECKEEVEEFIDIVLERVPEMEQQPEYFKKPQRGGKPPKKNCIENISNYMKKLEESVSIDQMLTDEDSEYSVSPPTRHRRPTVSYAQATKRLSFNNETILGTPKEATRQNNNTVGTTMSTLTQNSLDAALQQIREETERLINNLRTEMRTEVKNMEQSIAVTVIAAIQLTNPINMEVESDNRSTGSTSQDTTATFKLMMDRFDALTQVVQNLAAKISEIDSNANKRSRSPDTTVPIHEKPSENSTKGTRSPPAKLPCPTAPTPPSTPPPKEQCTQKIQEYKTATMRGASDSDSSETNKSAAEETQIPDLSSTTMESNDMSMEYSSSDETIETETEEERNNYSQRNNKKGLSAAWQKIFKQPPKQITIKEPPQRQNTRQRRKHQTVLQHFNHNNEINLAFGHPIKYNSQYECFLFHNINGIKDEHNWAQINLTMLDLDVTCFGFAEINTTARGIHYK